MPRQNPTLPGHLYAFACGVAAQLRSAGFDALFAGGCVRDRLLKRVPKDYDIATSAKPDEVEANFSANAIPTPFRSVRLSV